MPEEEIIYDQDAYQHLLSLVNAQTSPPVRQSILSYTQNYTDENIQDPNDRQAIIDKLDDILTPKTLEQLIALGTDSGAALLNGVSNLPSVLSDPAAATTLKDLAKSAAGIAFGVGVYNFTEAAKQALPEDQNFVLAKGFATVGTGIVAGGLFAALAADGALGLAVLATPLGAAAVGLLAGYAATQLLDHYFDDIITAQAQGLLDTVQGIDNFIDGLIPGLDSVIDGIVDGPGFFDGVPEFLNNMLEPVASYLPELPQWMKDVLGKFFEGVAELPPSPYSPLVFDLDGDGIELSAMNGTGAVYFDIDNDGIAERTGWVTGGDGLLALDRNGNGTIDAQNELFGDTATASNGFENLKALDSNADNKITSADAQWNNLRMWVDVNADGVSQAAELKTLASLGITSINLAYSAMEWQRRKVAGIGRNSYLRHH